MAYKSKVVLGLLTMVLVGATAVAGVSWMGTKQKVEPESAELVQPSGNGIYTYVPDFFSPGIKNLSKPLEQKIVSEPEDRAPGFICSFNEKTFYYSRIDQTVKALDTKACMRVFGNSSYLCTAEKRNLKSCVNQKNEHENLSFEVVSTKLEDKEPGYKSGEVEINFSDSIRTKNFKFAFPGCSCHNADDCTNCERQHIQTVDVTSGIPGRFLSRDTGGTDTQTQAEYFLSWGKENQEISPYRQGYEPLQLVASTGLFLDQRAQNFCCNSIGSTDLAISGNTIREYSSAILEGKPIAFFFDEPKMGFDNKKISVNVNIKFDGMEGDPSFPKEKEAAMRQLVKDSPFVEILSIDHFGEVTSVTRLANAHALDWQDENRLVVIRGNDLAIWNLLDNSFRTIEKKFIIPEEESKSQ